jgi:hypothetical protein
MKDMNGYVFKGSVMDYLQNSEWSNKFIYGQTGSFYSTDTAAGGSDPLGTNAKDEYKAVVPKRSRWYEQILRAREMNRSK